jgi:hypothetical protein
MWGNENEMENLGNFGVWVYCTLCKLGNINKCEIPEVLRDNVPHAHVYILNFDKSEMEGTDIVHMCIVTLSHKNARIISNEISVSWHLMNRHISRNLFVHKLT